MALRNIPPETYIPGLSSRELILAKIETERLEIIPLNRVLTEQALVDEGHADELGASMQQKRGQITPIAVRARIGQDNEIVYDVIDGFHRTAGKKRSGSSEINATVIYNCSDEEMFDLRILAASSVRSVQFPRIAQWITHSFATTPWARKGLSVSQAFAIAMNDSQRSNIVSLTNEEVTELKGWAKAKCARWGKNLGSTYGILRVVANADPELIRQVRTSGGGKDRSGKITPARLQAVVDKFPGEQNFITQKVILGVVVEKRFYAQETAKFVAALEHNLKVGMSEEEVSQYAKSVALQIQEEEEVTKDLEVLPPSSHETDDDTFEEIEEPSDDDLDDIEKAISGNGQVKSPVAIRKSTPSKGLAYKRESESFASGDHEDTTYLNARIKDLEEALKIATKAIPEAGGDYWWRTAPFLTPIERLSLERVVFANHSMEEVANDQKTTPLNILGAIRSAFSKRALIDRRRKASI